MTSMARHNKVSHVIRIGELGLRVVCFFTLDLHATLYFALLRRAVGYARIWVPRIEKLYIRIEYLIADFLYIEYYRETISTS